MARKANSKFAVTSLSLGLVGWVVYTLQWCFDLTLGILLAAFTAGISAVFFDCPGCNPIYSLAGRDCDWSHGSQSN
jgi:hypothetical protein